MKIWLIIGQIYVTSIFTLGLLYSSHLEKPAAFSPHAFDQQTLQQRAARVLIHTHQDHAIIASSKIPKYIKTLITQEQKYLDILFRTLTLYIQQICFLSAEIQEGNLTKKELTEITKAIKDACQAGYNINHEIQLQNSLSKEKKYMSLLMAMITLEDPQLVKLCLELGANPNLKNKNGDSALSYAIKESNPTIVKVLLDHGADINQFVHGISLLYVAGFNQEYGDQIIPILIQAGVKCATEAHAQLSQFPLIQVLEKGNLENFVLLLQAGAPLPLPTERYHSPLHKAIYAQNFESLKKLLSTHTIPINARNFRGETALNSVVAGFLPEQQIIKYIKELIKAGADVNIPDDFNTTPLLTAAIHNHHNVMKVLLEAGADPTIANNARESPHQLAASLTQNNRQAIYQKRSLRYMTLASLAGFSAWCIWKIIQNRKIK